MKISCLPGIFDILPCHNLLNHGSKAFLKVGKDILNVFKPDREADHTGVNPGRYKLFVRKLAVRCGGWMEHAGADIGNMDNIGGKL